MVTNVCLPHTLTLGDKYFVNVAIQHGQNLTVRVRVRGGVEEEVLTTLSL